MSKSELDTKEKDNLRQNRSKASTSASESKTRTEREWMELLMEKLENLQFHHAELLNKSKAWNRVAIVSETDAEGTLLYVNENFVRYSGYAQDELIGQKHNIVKSTHQQEQLFEQLWSTISSGKVWRGYLKNKTQNGDYYWVYTTIFPMLDDERKIVRYYSLAIPVTVLIEPTDDLNLFLLPAFALTPDTKERQLQQLRKQLQSLKAENEHALSSVQQAIMISETDVRGIITAVNDRICQISGYEKHELIGQNHRLLKSPNQHDSVYDELWKTITDGKTWQGTLLNRRKDGTEYRIELQITPEKNEEGKLRRYLAVSWLLSDTVETAFADQNNLKKLRTQLLSIQTEYEQSQQVVGELEDMQTLLFSQVAALNECAFVLEADENANLTFLNDSFIQFTGSERETLFGQPIAKLHADGALPPDSFQAFLKSLEGKLNWRGILQINKEIGGRAWVSAHVHAVKDDESGDFVKWVIIFQDITTWIEQIRQLESDLGILQTQEQELQRSVNDLYHQNNSLLKLKNESEHRKAGIDQAFALLETDPTGIVLFVNDNLAEQLGLSPDDLVGTGFDSWLKQSIEEEKAHSFLKQVLTGQAAGVKLEFKNKKLVEKSFWIHGCPIIEDISVPTKHLFLFLSTEELDSVSLSPQIKEQLEAWETELNQLRPQAERVKLLEAQLKERNAQLDTANDSVKTLEMRIEAFEQARIIQEQQQEQVLQQGTEQQTENENLLSKVSELQKEQKALQTELQQNAVRVEQLNAAQMARQLLEQRIQALVRDKEATQSNFLKAHEKQKESGAKLDQLNADLEQERRWSQELQERYSQLETEYKERLPIQEAQHNALRRLEDQYSELESKYKDTDEFRKRERDRAADLEEQALDLQKRFNDATSLNFDLGEELTEAMRRIEGADEERKSFEYRMDDLRSDLIREINDEKRRSERVEESFNSARRDWDSDRYNYEKRVESLESQIRELQREHGEDMRELDSTRNLLSARNERVDHELQHLRQELDQVGDQAQSLTFENERLLLKVKDLERSQTTPFASFPSPNSPVQDHTSSRPSLKDWVGFGPSEMPTISPESTPRAFPAANNSEIRILFVESDFPQLDVVGNWLSEAGYDFKLSSRGDDAIKLYASYRPHMMVVDLRLQGLNGFEVADVIRNDYEDLDIQILALTPVELVRHKSEYINSGFNDVFGKPYIKEELIEMIQLLRAAK